MENGKRTMGQGRRFWSAGVLTLLLGLCGGCQVEEALIDGFYGGISDTVATVVAEALLNAVASP
jgi:hypothetical protein